MTVVTSTVSTFVMLPYLRHADQRNEPHVKRIVIQSAAKNPRAKRMSAQPPQVHLGIGTRYSVGEAPVGLLTS